MSQSVLSLPNEVIILGHGLTINPSAPPQLTIEGTQHADRFLEYFHNHQNTFSSKGAMVVCSGEYALLAHGVARPEEAAVREGIVMADYLLRNNVPHDIIRFCSQVLRPPNNVFVARKV